MLYLGTGSLRGSRPMACSVGPLSGIIHLCIFFGTNMERFVIKWTGPLILCRDNRQGRGGGREKQGRTGRSIDLGILLQGKQHVGSVFLLGSCLLYLMLLGRDTVVKVGIKPHGNSVNKTADYFGRWRTDTPEKLRAFVTHWKVGHCTLKVNDQPILDKMKLNWSLGWNEVRMPSRFP